MVRRNTSAPGRDTVSGAAQTGGTQASSSNVAMLVVVVTFLMVTVAMIALQPRPSTEVAQPINTLPVIADEPALVTDPVVADLAVPTPSPEPQLIAVAEPTPEPIVVVSHVARADASLLELRRAVAATEASDILLQVTSATGAEPSDLPRLTASVLREHGHVVRSRDRLHGLLVSALANNKSDAYIDALLNTAAARGEFTPPADLTLQSGRLNTPKLLRALVDAAKS